MKPGATQLALCETRAFLARGRVMGGLLVVILILTVSGPFGTIDTLGPLARAEYWGVVAVLTFSPGVLVDRSCDQWIAQPLLRTMLSIALLVATDLLPSGRENR